MGLKTFSRSGPFERRDPLPQNGLLGGSPNSQWISSMGAYRMPIGLSYTIMGYTV